MIILISFEQVDNFSLFADRYFSRKSHANYTNIRSPHKPCMVITQFLSIPQGAEKDEKDHGCSTGQPRICCTLLTPNACRNILEGTQSTLLSMAKSKSFENATGHFHDDDTWLQLPEFISFLLFHLNLSISLRFKNNSPNLYKKKNWGILVVVVKWRDHEIVLYFTSQ